MYKAIYWNKCCIIIRWSSITCFIKILWGIPVTLHFPFRAYLLFASQRTTNLFGFHMKTKDHNIFIHVSNTITLVIISRECHHLNTFIGGKIEYVRSLSSTFYWTSLFSISWRKAKSCSEERHRNWKNVLLVGWKVHFCRQQQNFEIKNRNAWKC